jgi:sortase A
MLRDRQKRRKRPRRRLGVSLLVAGLLLIAYALSVMFWRDPVTDLYTRAQQHKLAAELSTELQTWPHTKEHLASGDGTAQLEKWVATNARKFQRRVEEGQALGRLKIDRLGLNVVFVEGTDWAQDLSKGPGHYEGTSLPGLGRTTAIAGHRTTFGAPFRHIDELRSGDPVVLELPYATFRYRVFSHEIVKSDDWSVVRDRGFDTLVLSACHPLYSASHRWIVYARLQQVKPAAGSVYSAAS